MMRWIALITATLAACGARPFLAPGHEGGATTPYPMTYTKQADNPSLHYGMYYSPENYRHCQKLYGADRDPMNITCDYLLLTRPEIPEYWPNGTPPPITFPAPPAEPTYKPGMTSEQYFKALCEKESGDFVFKTVKDVEGFYLVRPMYYHGDQIRRELFANEAPYFEFSILQLGMYAFYQFSRTYRFVEFPHVMTYPKHYIPPPGEWNDWSSYIDQPGNGPYWHYSWDDRMNRHARQPVPRYFRKRIPALESRYALTWRAIERTGFDRDLGVAGVEALLFDLHSGEVLAYRRAFIRAILAKPAPFHGQTGNGWNMDWQCPSRTGNRTATTAPSLREFIEKALIPAPPLPTESKED